MRLPQLTQRARLVFLVIDAAVLSLASWIAFGVAFPAADSNGFWFYTALFGLLLGSRIDTPFFVKPSDVFSYAAPAAVAIALVSSWTEWGNGVRVAYLLALSYCILSALLGAIAMVTFPSPRPRWQLISNAARVLAETLGAPQQLYTVVFVFALVAFHLHSLKEFSVLVAAWLVTGMLSPFEGSFRLIHRLRAILDPASSLDADGDVIAYQTPGLLLLRQCPAGRAVPGDIIAVHDPAGHTRVALCLDHVGRDEGLLLRAIDVPEVSLSDAMSRRITSLPPNSGVRLIDPGQEVEQASIVKGKQSLVGLVASDTSVGRMYFEVVKNEGLEEGRLVEVQIGARTVTYQLVNGLTKEEIVQQKNTRGFARAQAQKIGEWDNASERFRFVKWLPMPNAPVLLKDTAAFMPTSRAVGHFPGTDYPVSVKSMRDLVTHNTAILGILGIGKSMLALELVERMIAAGIKVVCLDLTDQYATELAPHIAVAQSSKMLSDLRAVGAAGKTQVHQNVEEGGSKAKFTSAVGSMMQAFVAPDDPRRLMVLNPGHFEVWRQDSKPFSGNASMASLSPAEIAHIVSQCTLEAVSSLGMTDQARVCLVYEEAHSLVPEWNSAVAEGDKAAANGCARAILQGRKYGLGCLLITQRTANVTKTILNQCNTIFAMRTFDDTGKNFLSNYIGAEYADSLSALSERQAVFFGKASSCENPVLIQLNNRDSFLQVFRVDNPPPVTAPVPAAAE